MSDLAYFPDDIMSLSASQRAADRLYDLAAVACHADSLVTRFESLAKNAGREIALGDIERAERLSHTLHTLASRLAQAVAAECVRQRLRRTEGK